MVYSGVATAGDITVVLSDLAIVHKLLLNSLGEDNPEL